MKGAALFVGGMLVGALLLQAGVAQDRSRRGVNHVGIATHDYDAALSFYKDTLGAKEAFTLRNEDGTVRLTYLQLSRDTFVELLPVRADQPTGVLHIGIETDDVAASVAALRASGMAVDDPTIGASRARVARIADPSGVQIEIMQMGADSLQRKAIDGWN